MQKTLKHGETLNLLERRAVGIFLSGILFAVNFLLFYFIWMFAFPELSGLARLAFCWVGAYALTWIMSLLAKGVARLALVLLFLGVLFVVFWLRP